MDLAFLPYPPQRVLESFRQGQFHALEILGPADAGGSLNAAAKSDGSSNWPAICPPSPSTKRSPGGLSWRPISAWVIPRSQNDATRTLLVPPQEPARLRPLTWEGRHYHRARALLAKGQGQILAPADQWAQLPMVPWTAPPP